MHLGRLCLGIYVVYSKERVEARYCLGIALVYLSILLVLLCKLTSPRLFPVKGPGTARDTGQGQKMNAEYLVYTYALRTRKSAGLMTRKLSVTESQKTAQFFGTSSRRKCRTDRQKSL